MANSVNKISDLCTGAMHNYTDRKRHQNCMKLSWMANQMIARIRSAIARLQIPGRSIIHVTIRKKAIRNTEIKEKEEKH